MVIRTQEERLPPERNPPPVLHIALAKEVLWGIRLSQPCERVSVRSSGSFCSSPSHIQEQYLPVSSPAKLPRTIRETTGKMSILYNFCWCPAFQHGIPLSPERWSIFSIITNLNLILGSAPEGWEKKNQKTTKTPMPLPSLFLYLSAVCSKRPATSKFPNHSFISWAVLWSLILQT